jgi:hypothetical protein
MKPRPYTADNRIESVLVVAKGAERTQPCGIFAWN